MAVGAIIENGKVVETASAASTGNTSKNSAMDKDAFLQLLVAQMKYQDPLEPTSNTEYISQYATFSELEQMQNMSSSLELSRASSYVGQTVTIRTQMSTGEYKEVQGKVDYVVFENNKAYLSVGGELYSASDVYATVDAAYQNAFDLAVAFIEAVGKLPNLDDVTLENKEYINNLKDAYNGMTSYQQNFIGADYVEKLQKYVTRLSELEAAEEAAKGSTDDDGESDGDGDSTDTV